MFTILTNKKTKTWRFSPPSPLRTSLGRSNQCDVRNLQISLSFNKALSYGNKHSQGKPKNLGERRRAREVTPKPLSVCCRPVRKSGKAENIPEAPTVIGRLEVGDALTQEESTGGMGTKWLSLDNCVFRLHALPKYSHSCFSALLFSFRFFFKRPSQN